MEVGNDEGVIELGFGSMREDSTFQFPTKSKAVPVGKNDSALYFQADISINIYDIVIGAQDVNIIDIHLDCIFVCLTLKLLLLKKSQDIITLPKPRLKLND